MYQEWGGVWEGVHVQRVYWILYNHWVDEGWVDEGWVDEGWVDEFHVTGEATPSFLDETVEEVLLVQGMFFA